MTRWNYRVVRRVVDGEVLVGIHEAYYPAGETDVPDRITVEPVAVIGDDLQGTLDRMAAALRRPVLDYDQVVRPDRPKEDHSHAKD